MTNYAMTICATRSALDTAIIGIADSATYKVWSYRDGGATKYLFVTPSPQGADST